MIKDVEGMKEAIEQAAYGLKYGTWVAKPLSKRKVFAIIDRFTVEEPLTVARIVAGDLIHLIDFDALHIWLEEHEYDGLWNETGEPHCGCDLDDFCPCGCPQPDCRPAYRHSDGMMYLEDEKDV
jgi:hypothetical protein